MRQHRLHRITRVPRSLDEIFHFFSQATNLETLTPAWLRFEIRSPTPIVMRPGTQIDYRISLRGIPIRWRSEITAWEPPHRFVDRQLRGPYRSWVHEHRFVERPDGTEVVDDVTYSVYGGWLVERFLVRPDLERIFDYRQRCLEEQFGSPPEISALSGGPSLSTAAETLS